jgi:Flp pilus assembly protein TadD
VDRGVVRYLIDQIGEAVADYDEALRLRPRDARTYYNRAGAYRRQGRIDQAIADYRQVLKLDPALVQARSKLQELGAPPP